MAKKSFAIPLDDSSKQQGDITFQKLTAKKTSVEFTLDNVVAGENDLLDLISSKGGIPSHHTFSVSVANGVASVTLQYSDMKTVFSGAENGDWDYVQAEWSLGSIDTPSSSNMHEIQGGQVYNYNGWPY